MGNLIDTYMQANPANNLQKYTDNNAAAIPTAKLNPINDSITFLEMSVILKRNKDLSGEGQLVQEGKVNNQDATIKTVVKTLPNNKIILFKEGIIGDKKLRLQSTYQKENDINRINYKGEYNNKNIDLNVEYAEESNKFKKFFKYSICNQLYVPDNIKIHGTIDNKPYEINLPDAKVPIDSDQKDLVTLLLENHNYQPGVINGNIVAINPGKARIECWEEKIEKRQQFFKEDVKPLISQALSTIVGTVVGIVIGRLGLKH